MIVNRQIVVGATPLQIETKTVMVRSLFIQMLTGGAGRGFVCNMSDPAVSTATPNPATGTHLSAELAAATASAPGGSWSYPDSDRGYDVSLIYLGGSNAGDKITVSYDKKV